jgi:hypothetical protein
MPGRHRVKPFRVTAQGGLNQERILSRIRDEVEALERTEGRLRALVGKGRADGMSWSPLAAALGVTAEGARKRYAR